MNDIQTRGMPRWREKQHLLPYPLKIQMIGEMIQETRRMERLKKSCNLSATSLSNSYVKES